MLVGRTKDSKLSLDNETELILAGVPTSVPKTAAPYMIQMSRFCDLQVAAKEPLGAAMKWHHMTRSEGNGTVHIVNGLGRQDRSGRVVRTVASD